MLISQGSMARAPLMFFDDEEVAGMEPKTTAPTKKQLQNYGHFFFTQTHAAFEDGARDSNHGDGRKPITITTTCTPPNAQVPNFLPSTSYFPASLYILFSCSV